MNSQITSTPAAALSLITATDPQVATKTFWIQKQLDGAPFISSIACAAILQGRVDQRRVASLHELADLLGTLRTDQCLVYGTAAAPTLKLLTDEAWKAQGQPADSISRTNENFAWPSGPGVMMLDFDPPEGDEAPGRDELVAVLRLACPGLADAAMLWWVSASSNIVRTDGGPPHSGVRGQRLYLLVRDARDIPRAGASIVLRLWAAGHGYIKISEAGTLLERTPFDGSVWQPSRIDFAAGARCGPGLRQERGMPVLVDGPVVFVDTVTALPDLTVEMLAAVEERKATAKDAAQSRATEVREGWIEQRAVELEKREPAMPKERARAVARAAVEGGDLHAEWPLRLADGSTVTVGEVLAARARYNRRATRDPLEPGYRGGASVGMLFLDGDKPVLHSKAHGGANYFLHTTTSAEVEAAATFSGNVVALSVRSEQPERAREALREAMNAPVREALPAVAAAPSVLPLPPWPVSDLNALIAWFGQVSGLDERGAELLAVAAACGIAARQYDHPTHIYAVACGEWAASKRAVSALRHFFEEVDRPRLVRHDALRSRMDLYAAVHVSPSRIYSVMDLHSQAELSRKQNAGTYESLWSYMANELPSLKAIHLDSGRDAGVRDEPGPITLHVPALSMFAGLRDDRLDAVFNRHCSASDLVQSALWADVKVIGPGAPNLPAPKWIKDRANAIAPRVDDALAGKQLTLSPHVSTPPKPDPERGARFAPGAQAPLPDDVTDLLVKRIAVAVAAWESVKTPEITPELVERARLLVVRGQAEYVEHHAVQENEEGRRTVQSMVLGAVAKTKKEGLYYSRILANVRPFKTMGVEARGELLNDMLADGELVKEEGPRGGARYWATKFAPEKLRRRAANDAGMAATEGAA